MNEIRRYACGRGIKPATVLQNAANLSGTTWEKWNAGAASCSIRTADRVRAYMAANPAQTESAAE
ncbi:MAG TPA: XRE family transcriptional regulator [Paracoccus sp.]|nr:XRE family transcriptional regulator [Paracoccus sp. (in: a-proteobacteria)]